jgi:hypothetical protein
MRSFTEYKSDAAIEALRKRVAWTMAIKGVEPRAFIDHCLRPRDEVMTEWLGGFFKRLGNAWRSFVGGPGETPAQRVAAADRALTDLVDVLQKNQGADPRSVRVVLTGIEQALQIVKHVTPTVRQLDARFRQYMAANKGGQAPAFAADPADNLPDDLHQKYVELMRTHNQLMQLPDGEAKKESLVDSSRELEAFLDGLENTYQQIDPADSSKADYKQRVGNFLRRIDTDKAFRDVRDLLSFARRTHQGEGGLLVNRPFGHEEASAVYNQPGAGTEDDQKTRLKAWYGGLPPSHPVKKFIQGERESGEHGGMSEDDLLHNYAAYWASKYPHHLSR